MWSLAGISTTTPLQPTSLTTLISSGMQREKREDFGLEAQRGDVGDGGLVLRRHGRHAGLDAVDAERIELLGDRDLLLAAEHDGRLLLAVAQRDVVNLDVWGERVVFPDLRQVTPGADEPFVGFPGLHVSLLM